MKIKGFADTIKWYDKNAQRYAETTARLYSQSDKDEFIALLPKSGRILDAGCGPGRDAGIFAQRGFFVCGVDISKGLLAIARRQFPKIKFTYGNLTKLPYKARCFDGVWSNASLLHLERLDEAQCALSEFNRVLKPGGVLHVLVKAQTGQTETAIVKDSISNHERFFRYFKPKQLEKLVAGAGFNIVRIEIYNEAERNPGGRQEVDWIRVLARRV